MLTMILAGGRGERLSPLTMRRPKPCVHFGGSYRIIDFVLSNFFNSGFRNIYILSQYHAHSMGKHIMNSWSKWAGFDEFIIPLSPETNAGREEWFKGTADAIWQYLRFVEYSNVEHIAIFGGDHIYKMDIRQMLDEHKKNDADLTIAALEIPLEQGDRFGIISAEENDKIVAFTEKPNKPKSIVNKEYLCYASMGNYIFKTQVLIEALKNGKDQYTNLDFGKHIIPMLIDENKNVFAYNFNNNRIPGMTETEIGYWKDVGTIDSYYEANMDLIHVTPQLNLYNEMWPILTNIPNLPPAKTVFDENDRKGQAINSYISPGTIISGGCVNRSILGNSCRIHSYSSVDDSILFDKVSIGRNTKVKRAIIDKAVSIPADTTIGFDFDADRAKGYTVTDSGIVLVPRSIN